MSEATEDDLRQHLTHLRGELEQAIDSARNAHAANMSMKGTLGSGTDLKGSVGALETTIVEHLDEGASLVARWSGPNLARERARAMVTAHIRSAIEALVTAETAYKVGSRRTSASSVKLLDGLIVQAKTRLSARLREFELGADRPKDSAAPSNIQIVHAQNIIGGVMQAGRDATQANSVQLSAETIGASLDHLLAQVKAVAPELEAQIEPDATTIRAQLTKGDPNSTIVQEAGKSIRNVLEGAVGGVLGNAMTPALVQALGAFMSATGLN